MKLMELDVQVRCRKTDVELVKSILPDTGKKYAEKLKTEVPKLKGKEIKVKLRVDEANFLPEVMATEGQVPSG